MASFVEIPPQRLEGEVHSPRRDGPTRLIRIEGMNMDGVTRDRYLAA